MPALAPLTDGQSIEDDEEHLPFTHRHPKVPDFYYPGWSTNAGTDKVPKTGLLQLGYNINILVGQHSPNCNGKRFLDSITALVLCR